MFRSTKTVMSTNRSFKALQALLIASRCEADLEKALRLIARTYGLKHVAYVATALPRLTRMKPYSITTYPTSCVRSMISGRDRSISSLLHLSARLQVPLDWDDITCAEPIEIFPTAVGLRSRARAFVNNAKKSGLGGRGLTFPIRCTNGERASFTVHTNAPRVDWSKFKGERLSELEMLAGLVHEKVLEINGISIKQVSLTKREQEVLTWLAHGKTASDVGSILNLSQHTVRCYFENAKSKMGTSNLAHTVARAVAQNLIAVAE